MVNVIPQGAHIKTLKQSAKNLTINGVAQSNARVSAYMRNIDGSAWLTKPQLNIIQKKGKTKQDSGRDFILRAEQLAQPKQETQK